MEAKYGRDTAVLRDARKSSLLTQSDMAKRLGKSVATIVEYEKHPEQVSLSTLREYYTVCGTDGREWIKEYAASFFA